MKHYKEELIAVARKMRPRHVRFWDERIKLISHVQSMICKSLDHDITWDLQKSLSY